MTLNRIKRHRLNQMSSVNVRFEKGNVIFLQILVILHNKKLYDISSRESQITTCGHTDWYSRPDMAKLIVDSFLKF
jgi:hypothetical protein